MSYTRTPHLKHPVFQNQENPTESKKTQGEGWPDKRRADSARVRSAQPAAVALPLRAQPLTTKTPRSQNVSVHKPKKVKLTLWVDPIDKEKLQLRAAREELSLSAVGAAGLKV